MEPSDETQSSSELIVSQYVDGFQIPIMFPTEEFRSAMQYKPRPGDLFIVTYPKCGTTWAQQVLLLIFRQGEPLESLKEFNLATPFMDVRGAKSAENMPRPNAIKTHLPFHLVPWSEQAKYIYIARNPKDCCVSYFHHTKNIPRHGFKGNFDQYFELFLSGKVDYGDCFDHLMEWYEHSRYFKPYTMSETSATLPTQIIEGLKMTLLFPADVFRSGIQYKPRPDDVFIVTYPKCGTTWAQHILLLLFSRGEPVDERKFFSATPFLEVAGAKAAETMPRPGAVKTHLPFRLTPWSNEAKYIYITRNPKDCCVSYYHHMKNLPVHGFKGTFDEFFEHFISGDIGYGDYFDNLLGWYEHRNDPNVLFMTYEDMKENPEAAILKMASFIDEEKYAKPLREDPEKLQRVVKYSSFKHMKVMVNKNLNDLFNMSKEELLKSDLPDEMKKAFDPLLEEVKLKGEKPEFNNFVRKGIVGDWRNYFSEEQSKRMDQKFSERMNGTELEKLWRIYTYDPVSLSL
ncbi:unnamed protein product [Larinioides sclopetarius]